MKNKLFLQTLITGFLFCISVVSIKAQTTLWVTSKTDAVPSVPGQLRYAIEQANLTPSVNTVIKFNLPLTGTNPTTIQLVSILPLLNGMITIDGTTQPGYVPGAPKVIIDGSKGLANQYAWIQTGISLVTNAKLKGVQVQYFYTGVQVWGTYIEVLNNTIKGCHYYGIHMVNAVYCVIKGNYISTDKDGGYFSPRPRAGIYIAGWDATSHDNMIGGTGCDEGNVIGYLKDTVPARGIDNDNYWGGNNKNRYSRNVIHGYHQGIDLKGLSNTNIAKPVITSTGCTTSGTSLPYATIDLFGRKDNSYLTADVYLTTVTANSSGNWSATLSYIEWAYITATQTDANNNTSELATGMAITQTPFNFSGPEVYSICVNDSISFLGGTLSGGCGGTFLLWDFGDGSPLSTTSWHRYTTTGVFTVTVYAVKEGFCKMQVTSRRVLVNPCVPCENCIGSFAPEPGKYYISAWVRKEGATPTTLTFTDPQLTILFPSFSSVGPLSATGDIIDGWQRIYEPFTIPVGATNITIRLGCASGNCLFDDIRIYPENGTVKSYVYDPVTLKLTAELDERNYATFYEYDEEGKLIRVKKETEKGIMTIKENKDNTNKR